MSIENLDKPIIEIIMENLDIVSRINLIAALRAEKAFSLELRAYETIIATKMANGITFGSSMDYIKQISLHERISEFSVSDELINLRANPNLCDLFVDTLLGYYHQIMVHMMMARWLSSDDDEPPFTAQFQSVRAAICLIDRRLGHCEN